MVNRNDLAIFNMVNNSDTRDGGNMRTYASTRARTFVLMSAWIFEEVESVPLNFGSIFGHMLIGCTMF